MVGLKGSAAQHHLLRLQSSGLRTYKSPVVPPIVTTPTASIINRHSLCRPAPADHQTPNRRSYATSRHARLLRRPTDKWWCAPIAQATQADHQAFSGASQTRAMTVSRRSRRELTLSVTDSMISLMISWNCLVNRSARMR